MESENPIKCQCHSGKLVTLSRSTENYITLNIDYLFFSFAYFLIYGFLIYILHIFLLSSSKENPVSCKRQVTGKRKTNAFFISDKK